MLQMSEDPGLEISLLEVAGGGVGSRGGNHPVGLALGCPPHFIPVVIVWVLLPSPPLPLPMITNWLRTP